MTKDEARKFLRKGILENKKKLQHERVVKTYKDDFYTINSLLGNDWARFYYLLGGREAGKSYATLKWITNRKLKNPDGVNQYSYMVEIPEETIKKEKRKAHHPKTAVRLGVEYQIASRTVMEYGNYANSIDILEKDEPELVAQVLKGDIKIGQQKIIDLSQQTTKVKNKIEKFLKEQEKSHRKPPIEPVEHKVTVKDMPKYDPDAEIVSLSFTIPSWIGSIDRVLSKVKFETTSEQARQKLKSELNNLNFAVDTMLLAMEGE